VYVCMCMCVIVSSNCLPGDSSSSSNTGVIVAVSLLGVLALFAGAIGGLIYFAPETAAAILSRLIPISVRFPALNQWLVNTRNVYFIRFNLVPTLLHIKG
jgi:hypothetical protein